MTQKERKINLNNSKGINVNIVEDTDSISIFENIDSAEDVIPRLKNVKFADERKRKSGIASKTITYLDKDSNARMTIKVSDAKNINDNIEIERVRNLKVITVGTPATVSQDVLRFLTGK